MNISILKKLLPGLIPLFIFILADEIWGTRIGLIVAIVVGIAELIFIWFKEKRFDKFIVFDTALLVGLGLISILFDNDIFFKLKPGIIQLIFLTIIGLSAFSKHNIMLLMTRRYMKYMQIEDEHVQKLRQTMRILFWVVLAHTILVFYSAFYMSNEAWVFISGVLFYIIFGLFFVYEFIKNKLQAKRFDQKEWLPLVDEKGTIVGKARRSECHKNKDNLHPVVHMHVLNEKGHLLLQKRSQTKEIQAGKWDTAVGGHIEWGEQAENSLKREALEEIGITDFKAGFITNYIWESDIERELVYTFGTVYEGVFNINKKEVDEVRFWNIRDIQNSKNKELFTPNLIHEIKLLKKLKIEPF